MSLIVIFIFIVFVLQLNLTEPESLSCDDRDSCRGVIVDHRDEIKERNCFCDQVCIQYDDCCADFPQNRSSFTSIGTCIDYMYPFRIRSQPYVPTVMPVWMIDQCLEHYRWTSLEKNCSLPEHDDDLFFSHPAALIPITSQSTNFTYRNVFCALCNDEKIEKLMHWSLDIVCQGLKKNYVYRYDNGLDLVHLPPDDAEKCVHRLIFPSNSSRKISPCKKQTINSCPKTYTTNQTIIDLCSTVNAYRYVTHSHPQLIREHSLYRNEFCLECHDVWHSRNYLESSCEHQLDDELFIDPKPKTGRHGFFRLSILFDPQTFAHSFPKASLTDLHYHSSYQTHVSSIYPCRQTEIYDFHLHHCLFLNNEIDWRLSQSLRCENFVLIRDASEDKSETMKFEDQILSQKRGDFIRLFSDRKKILLCAERFPFIYIHHNRWITTIRYSSTLVSTIALLIFLIAFYQKSTLHNLPGRCLLCLSVCLQLSQLSFLASGHLIDSMDRWTCIATGMIIHFFYLSTFAWLTVISFDTCITLTQMHRVDARMARNRLILYNVCVWSFSSIFLFISILLFVVLPRDHRWSPNYGRTLCSISSSLILILFFLLPIGCLLSINLFLFFRTVLAIRRIDRDTQLARCLADQDRSRTILYLRLAFLMGLHWLFLVICLLFRDEFLWFIFDLSHAFPSLFISIGFLRQRHQTSHIRSSQSQGSSIGTTTRTAQSHSDASPNIQMVRKLDDITVKLENISRQLLRPRPIPTDRHSASSL